MKKVLSGLTPAEWEAVVAEVGQPRFVAKQLAGWLYNKRIFGFDEMSNISKRVRDVLAERYDIGRCKPVKRRESKDGTVKYLFAVAEGRTVEAVFIPDHDRGTLCVSSQVGCKMGCRFCMTGRQGFEANLSAAEILNQIYSLPEFDRLTNIVFMGQGEPFDNTGEVLRALEVLTADWGLAWSPKRITVSTVGVMKGLQRFLKESRCNLAVSLHFAFGGDRADHMPAQRPYPVEDVVELLKDYFPAENSEAHQRRLSFEYILFEGINDKVHHLDKIVKLLRGLECRVNLIPFHRIPDSPYTGATEDRLKRTRNYLTSKGLFATVRASRGQDIEAACGLLNTRLKGEKD